MNVRAFEYEVSSPPPISEDEYRKQALEEYHRLLQTSPEKEEVFQDFLEVNPAFVPGMNATAGSGSTSSHGPFRSTLISQPRIKGIEGKIPDFMWLAFDSSVFSPVLIEIEAPAKKYFTKKRSYSGDLAQALTQLNEWKTILNDATYRSTFFRDFDIPLDLQAKGFWPVYILIYGRRNEFEHDQVLNGLKASLNEADQRIMSFDRLEPFGSPYAGYATCKVKTAKYEAIGLDPRSLIGHKADFMDDTKFTQMTTDKMMFTANQRKAFLQKRIPFWQEYWKLYKKDPTSVVIDGDSPYLWGE
ncbi:MAG: DUF4263 domain-containing protein [Saprospiraceae bacterium]|nr:DUF4263 domain-containing protein [Saprospiraceae bacterium]